MKTLDPQLESLPTTNHPRRRSRKRDFYRKCRSRPATPRNDPSARNPMRAEVDAYLEYWRLMGFREAGVLIRQKALRRFESWADARGLRSAAQITAPLLELYRRELFLYRKADGMPLAMNSQQLLLVPLKGFFKWLSVSGRIEADPAAKLVLPRKPARLPVRVLSVAEVERAIREADTSAPWGVRDRVVPIGGRASYWLGEYLEAVRPRFARPAQDAALFLTDYAGRFEKNRLGDLVRRHLHRAGVRVPGACHLLRHACATHMLENGADIRFIQALLGHADLRSTQFYTHVSIGRLKDVHTATHPAGLAIGLGSGGWRGPRPSFR
jgi:integrase/recombinase XerD